MKIDKISFFEQESNEISSALQSLIPIEREAAKEIICDFLSVDSDFSFAFAFTHGTCVARCFDGAEYTFSFPYEISEYADVFMAVEETVRYAVLEEIEPVFEGVPAERVGMFFTLGYRHINADSDSPDSDTYRISLKSECALIDCYPEAACENTELCALRKNDFSDYERLCRDVENNKYWGYDYREDYGDAKDVSFAALAERDFELSSALSLAIMDSGKFVGEALISSFDYKGGADISVRILPEFQNKGYGSRALSLLFEIAEKMGLVKLYARVYKENAPSISLFSKQADEAREEKDTVVFVYNLY